GGPVRRPGADHVRRGAFADPARQERQAARARRGERAAQPPAAGGADLRRARLPEGRGLALVRRARAGRHAAPGHRSIEPGNTNYFAKTGAGEAILWDFSGDPAVSVTL